MSAYIQFFIRNNEAFMPIGTYCRSSAIYQAFDEYIPWEKIRPITEPLLRKIYSNVIDDIREYTDHIDKTKEHRAFIATFNNPMDEKIEMLDSIEEILGEYEEGLEQLNTVKSYIHFLNDIIEAVEFEDSIDENNYLYAGIEVGISPTVEDIVQ